MVGAEGKSLASRLDEAVTEAATGVMNRYGVERSAALPALVWFVRPEGLTGMADVGSYAEDEVASVLSRWAGCYGLERVADRPHLPCMVEYAGTIEGHHVRIWGITNRGGWEAAVSTRGSGRAD